MIYVSFFHGLINFDTRASTRGGMGGFHQFSEAPAHGAGGVCGALAPAHGIGGMSGALGPTHGTGRVCGL